ncbi:MAG: lysophospholipid acyltransferase family protein [Planctomycetota bacterium]|nr:lysophospholipid acyltransferase family protein [Planctomycetota bacterium]
MSAEPKLRTKKGFTYSTCQVASWLTCRLYIPTKVIGLENIPKTGPVVIACNHQSWLDIPIVTAFVPRHVSFVAKDSLAKGAVMAHILEHSGAVLLRRGESDVAAMREMVAHLAEDDCLCVFPEGTRSRDGSMADFQRGALLAARKGKAQVIPTAISGSFGAWPVGQRIPHPHRITLRFGKPMDPRDGVEKVQSEVAALLKSR